MSNGNLPFSMETLMEQCGGNSVIVGSVLDEFLNQVPTDLSEMESGMSGGDLLSSSKAAHRLKGTAGVMGAMKLHPLCAEMEQVCKAGSLADAQRIFAELKAEAAACVEAVPTARSLLS